MGSFLVRGYNLGSSVGQVLRLFFFFLLDRGWSQDGVGLDSQYFKENNPNQNRTVSKLYFKTKIEYKQKQTTTKPLLQVSVLA
jgi:hypothetical protein